MGIATSGGAFACFGTVLMEWSHQAQPAPRTAEAKPMLSRRNDRNGILINAFTENSRATEAKSLQRPCSA